MIGLHAAKSPLLQASKHIYRVLKNHLHLPPTADIRINLVDDEN